MVNNLRDRPSILFSAFQTNRESNGGFESATQIFEALSNDFQWTLLTNRKTQHSERWEAGGARVVYVPFESDKGKFFRISQLVYTGLRAIFIGAHIFHGNDIRGLQVLLPSARLKSRPLVLTLRDTKLKNEEYGRNWHTSIRSLDALVTLSNDMATRVSDRLPIYAARQRTIGSIVNLEEYRPRDSSEKTILREKLGIAKNEIAIGMVGGVLEKKRQYDVIHEVVPQLTDLPIRLHIVGDFNPVSDSYSKKCVEITTTERLGKYVVFHGYQSNVAEWLSSFDILLIASLREGLARCMIEAMACGIPVISTDVCSAAEVLTTSGAGVVVGIDDWEAMVKVLRNASIKKDISMAMGRAGREAAMAQFSVNYQAEKWRNFYLELAHENNT